MTSFFDFNAVDDFDGHIRRSIPNLSSLHTLCHRLTYALSQDRTWVVDLGCSTGKFLRETEKKAEVSYIGVDIANMVVEPTGFTFVQRDILDFAFSGGLDRTSVVLSLFTMQFLPYSERTLLLQQIGEGLVRGGAAIIAEKVHLPDHHIDNLVERSLVQWKRGHFSDRAILEKSNQLATSMRLSTQTEVLALMAEHIGPPSIVWAYGAFMCAVSIKN